MIISDLMFGGIDESTSHPACQGLHQLGVEFEALGITA